MTDSAASTSTATAPPADGFWGSYAIALLSDLEAGPEIVDYLRGIESTLAPFGGRFLVHAAPWEQVEGDALGDPVVVGFPARDGARRWYDSDAYQAIASLRTRNSVSRVYLSEGVGMDHRCSTVIEALTT